MTSMVRKTFSLALAGLLWLAAPAGAQQAAASAGVLTADQAVQLALEHNSQVIGANAGVQDARGGVYGAYSGVLPHLSAGYARSGSWTRDQRGTQVFGSGFRIPSSTERAESYSTQPALSGSWSILNLSAIAGLSSARTGLRAAELSRSATRNDVALEARRQFYEVVKAVRLVDVQNNALRLARDNERRVRALFEVGSVSKSDLLRAQVTTAQAELDSIVAVNARLVQRDALASYVGLEEARLGEVDTTLVVEPRTWDEPALLREAAGARPDLRAAELEVKSARASLSSARFDYLPYVTLGGSAVFNGRSTQSSTARDSAGREITSSGQLDTDRQLSGRVALNWDFFDGLATRSRIAGARARVDRAQAAHDLLRRNLAAEVHEALQTYEQVQAGEAVARRSLDSANENLKLTQQKYNVGSATILDLVDAQVQLQRAESQLVSALAAIRVAEARVERVRGRME